MKKFSWLLIFMPLLLSAVELAPNSNFEQMSGKNVRNWHPARGWKGKTDYRCSKGLLCIERNESGSGAYMSTPIPVIPGKKYTVSVRWKATMEKGIADLALNFLDAKGKRISYKLVKRINKSFDMTDSSGEVTAPQGAVSAQMLLVLSGTGNVEFYRVSFSDGAAETKSDTGKIDMPGNCVPNADFKKLKNGLPVGWAPQLMWKGKSEYGVDADGYPFIKRTDRKGSGAYAATFPVRSGGTYAVSAEVKSDDIIGNIDISLQFVDAKGKIFGYQLIGKSQKAGDWKKFQKIINVPPTAVKVRFLLVIGGQGKALFRNPFFGENVPDPSVAKTANLILNPSFEEADIQAQFIDSWQIVTGSARRAAGFSHGEHSLELSPGSRIRYGWDAPAISVAGIPVLYRHLSASGEGELQWELTFFDASGKKILSESRVLPSGKEKIRTLNDKIQVPAGAVTASTALVNNSKLPVKADAMYLGAVPFTAAGLGRIIPVEKEPVCNVPLTMPVNSVRNYQGAPTWFIGDTPVVNSTFTSSLSPNMRKSRHDYYKRVLKCGKFPILVIGASITPENVGETHTLETALAKTDFSIRASLAEVPDARFVIWLFMEPSFAFAGKYPDDIIKLENPSLKWASAEPPYSYGSEIWGRQCARRVKEYLYALRSKPYADRIVGISPGLGKYAENNGAHARTVGGYSAGDFSPAMINFFRQWLFKEYKGDVAAFAKAWGKSGNFNFTDAMPPSSFQRVQKIDGAFFNPAKQRQVIDYSRCGSFVILHRVLKLFQGAKEATENRIFTFAQFAYFTGSMGHRELMPALESPYLDSFGPAPPYINRGAGDDVPDHGPAASVREHNKVWLCQADIRSHLASDHNWMYGRTASEAESIGVYLREMGHYMTSAIIPYHMTFENWYDSPALLKLVGEFDSWMALSGHFPRHSTAETAIVYDPVSMGLGLEFSYVRRIMPPHQSTLEYNRTFEWHHLGTNYDFFVLDDLLNSPKLDQYKTVIMAVNSALTPKQRQLIGSRLCRNGRTVVWIYTPGLFLHDGTEIRKDVANTSISGFKLEMDDQLHNLAVKMDNGKVYGRFTTDIYGGFTTPKRPIKVRPETFRPRFRVVPEKGVTVFGHYAEDNTPAAAIRKFKDHTSVFWGSTALNKEVLRPIMEKSGVHFYTSMPAVVYANSNFLTVHTPVAGKREIRLPRRVEVIYDLYAKKVIASNTDRVTVDMEKNSSVLLYSGSLKELQTAVENVRKASELREKKNARDKAKYKFVIQEKQPRAKKADPQKMYTVNSDGFIRFWQFIGPFPNYEKENAFHVDFLNGEAGIKAAEKRTFQTVFDATPAGRALERSLWFNGKAEKKVLDLHWRPVEFSAGITTPVFEEITDLPFVDRMAYYVFCKVISDTGKEVILSIGSDDGNKSYFNGKLCSAVNPSSRGVVPESEQARVMLKKGENHLLLKVCQGQGRTGHAVRFLDPVSKKPVTDIKIAL